MGGFFKKVAGAFVYLEDEEGKKVAPGSAKTLEADDEADELIRRAARMTPESHAPKSTPPPIPKTAPTTSASAMAMDADEVYASAGIAEGPNSSQRLLKIISSLSMFPREQQALMVRAMDAADDAWSEKEVLGDARRRQSILRSHLQAIDTERKEKLDAVAARIDAAQADGKRRLEDIDGQISELQKLRQEAVAATASALTEFEMEKKQTEEAAEKARRSITAGVNALSDLITFFTGGETKPAPKP
jgi:hypothetical protein